MVQLSFSNQQLYEIGRLNYGKLIDFCTLLQERDYWEKPQSILNMPIQAMLDAYLQAVLIKISIDAGRFNEEEKNFICSLTKTNPFKIDLKAEIDGKSKQSVDRLTATPPIFLQLCDLMDKEQGTKIAGQAFDCILNIILALAYLNNGKTTSVLKLVEEYYKKVCVFLNSELIRKVLTQKYIFRKICNDRLDCQYYQEFFIGCQEKECDFSVLKEKQKRRIEKIKEEMQHEKEENLLERWMEELNELIGLEKVKQEMNSLINLIKVKKMREQYGLPSTEMSYHMVFTGNPGTGKTTVARLVAKIYKELGILTKGNLVETDRSGLVAGYVGQTALKVKEVVESAVGGVLFIDEAYSLSNQGIGNDFGGEAIDALVKLMEDNRNDLVVIVAGYSNEMKQFIHSNPGLVSRFNKYIDFVDYSSEELGEILAFFAKKSAITFDADAVQCVEEQFERLAGESKQAFGNGRGVRNTFERILVNQANRIVLCKNPTQEQLSTIIKEDVQGIIV
ncbi:AAA family ATPase [Anaeromicropila populeti]|uniref:ATPase family associated with various cellular activities (AAA) n=1 Tax=Anaeromicropila populeti TaxID=37658 RepID=A0A1I6KJI9_9FIRM|nr:AAA family ATPase [Anaeromicropila populeti]SFR91030.1 ATPase family associated with various cellular activities (AAA) [Anaeromicropila populeti]